MKRTLPVLILSLALTGNAFAAKMVIKNTDKAGVGFNDKTAAAPVGGNNGTTLGEQRMNVFLKAAEIWGGLLTSDVDIIVDASFAPNTECTVTSGVLAFAGPTRISRDFKNAPLPGVWYPIALANKFAGTDLEPTAADIRTSFNSAVGTPTCLPSRPWYLGLDGNHGEASDLLVTVLHELTHGLGMTGSSNPESGELRSGFPNVTELHTYDVTKGLRWDQMSDAQRLASAVNIGNLVWDGESTRGAAASYLKPAVMLHVNNRSSLASHLEIQDASFGPKVTSTIAGKLVEGFDAMNTDGPTATDGCSTYTNAAAVRGNIVLVDRGTCTFAAKALIAQAVGAAAIVVINDSRDDAACGLPPMGGTDDSVRIPAIGIRRVDGVGARQAAADGQTASLAAEPGMRGGANGPYLRLYAPCEYDGGSSVHHFDTAASPNLLMEPFISGDLPAAGTDVTLNFLRDIGWGAPATGRRILRR